MWERFRLQSATVGAVSAVMMHGAAGCVGGCSDIASTPETPLLTRLPRWFINGESGTIVTAAGRRATSISKCDVSELGGNVCV